MQLQNQNLTLSIFSAQAFLEPKTGEKHQYAFEASNFSFHFNFLLTKKQVTPGRLRLGSA